jgi:hypothetical protein
VFNVGTFSAAFQNDETLLLIHSPLLARHFEAEIDRLWRGAELGIGGQLARRMEQRRRRCGSGQERPSAAAMTAPSTIR